MRLSIVPQDQFEKEKEKLCPSPAAQTKIVEIQKGRGNNPEVPDSLRKVIGETGAIDGRQEALELAKNFGISPSSVSAYSQGATSTASYDERPSLNHILNAKEKISKRARGKLVLALNHITEEKIQGAKLKDISSVAKDMSAIIKNMEPPAVVREGADGPTFIFYSPQLKKSEDTFDIVHAKE